MRDLRALAARLRRLRRLRGDELRDLGAASRALASAQLRVWTRPTGRLVRARGGAPPAAAPGQIEAIVARATLAVQRAARCWPVRPSCLVRSLALAALLERRGVPGGAIRIGVRRDGAVVDAHAWVELHGRVVGDDPRHTRRFTPLGALTAADRR